MPPRGALLERLVATVLEEVLDGAVVDGSLLRTGVHDPCVRRRVVRQVQSDRHGPMPVCSSRVPRGSGQKCCVLPAVRSDPH